MFVQEIKIPEQNIALISPKAEHAEISFKWVSGSKGRQLLAKMGNNLPSNWEASLKEEQQRINDFLIKEDEINWTITFHDKVIGAVWLDLREGHLAGPHIMIAEESVHGKGIATKVLKAVCGWAFTTKTGELKRFNYNKLITRCRVDNPPIIRVLQRLGFKPVDVTYDEDGFTWQNYLLEHWH
jgi:RimJ/RimL family protein N-acetyltransferase